METSTQNNQFGPPEQRKKYGSTPWDLTDCCSMEIVLEGPQITDPSLIYVPKQLLTLLELLLLTLDCYICQGWRLGSAVALVATIDRKERRLDFSALSDTVPQAVFPRSHGF